MQWDKEAFAAVTGAADFRRGWSVSEGRTVVSPNSLVNLFLLMWEYVPKICDGPVTIAELGVAKGGSLLFLATLGKAFVPHAQMLGIDVFEGHPAEEIGPSDWHKAGDFAVTPDEVTDLYRMANQIVPSRIIRKKFSHAAADVAASPPIALCHIDADTKIGVSSAIEATIDHMVPGGYMVFDDPLFPTCLGAMEAVENIMIRRHGLNAEQVCPHLVFRVP